MQEEPVVSRQAERMPQSCLSPGVAPDSVCCIARSGRRGLSRPARGSSSSFDFGAAIQVVDLAQ